MKQSGNMTTRAGWLMLETLTGLFLLAALGMTLAVAANVRVRAAGIAAGQRASLAAAQEALANLQAGGTSTSSDPAAQITVERTGPRVGTSEWVEITVVREGRRASLVGLAPARRGGSS